ncbi:ROK family glucokinase [Halalkalibacter oceani]|uniref:Glucokinase n=1 Tax=Halalkalibacter oceani TaxID=1653776 RepID=A0A9X2DPW1_9BACI|nr:ROK family glucokinase [Halalkalibacter oceani]MCM3712903.1 ROK family glucokinase [Halalkalibacter oceani]
MEEWYVGIDVGGTTIKMAFITATGQIVTKWEIPTNKQEEGKYITTDIANEIAQKWQKHKQQDVRLTSLGLGAPCFFEMETGFVYQAVNIGWRNFPLKDELEQKTGLPVTVDNDANMAALGEMWRGAGEGAANLLCVTLGTGVGGGIIANGRILHGVNGMAGEIGHITAVPEGGAPCNCGKTGCLETIASATGIARLAIEQVASAPDSVLHRHLQETGKLTAKQVFKAYAEADEAAEKVVKEVGFHLGLALANLANALNPEIIVIGGGVSRAGEPLLAVIEHYFSCYALKRVKEGVRFKIATLGNDAGVIGGAWLARESRQQI